MLATVVSASPVESVLSCSIDALVIVSTCSGNLPCLPLGARGSHAHLGVEPAQFELNRHVDHRFGRLNHDGARRLGEPWPGDDDEVRAGGRRVELESAVRAGIRRRLLPGGHAAQHDMTVGQRRTGDIRHNAANAGGKDRCGRQNGRNEYRQALNR